ncbi:millepora cytotoxin-1-like [Dendronephthya gigantea]|uniref:millepora cytotoxin-1-like n=1 Tax=Dendronephthya gigantea TaxID=151771 RepID=UPI00106AA550|nr:millepora cytotoxin-1-like [Dendronephthya gigantea]
MIGKLLCLLSLQLAFVGARQLSATPYDQTWARACLDNERFTKIVSRHNNYKEDRQWEFTCEPSGVTLTNCKWTGYQNGYDGKLDYTCQDGVINGIKSVHNNYYEDRQWAFYCCDMGRYIKRCADTAEVNYLDNTLNFKIMPGYFLSGMSSLHYSHYEDRIFRFFVCRF